MISLDLRSEGISGKSLMTSMLNWPPFTEPLPFLIKLAIILILLMLLKTVPNSSTLCLKVLSGICSLQASINVVIKPALRCSGISIILMNSKIKPSFVLLNSLSLVISPVLVRTAS